MDEDSNLKQSLLRGSQSSRTQSERDDGRNDSDDTFDTFETVAYNAPRGRSATARWSSVGGATGLAPDNSGPVVAGAFSSNVSSSSAPSRLGRSTTYCTSQSAALQRDGDASDEVVMAYKQKYARMDMSKVSFMSRFRSQALQLDREPSTRMDSATIVKMEETESGELSPSKNAAADVLSEISHQPQQMMQGAMGSAFVDVRKRASEMKQKESRSHVFAFVRVAFEVVLTTIAVLAAIAVAIHDATYPGFLPLWGVPLLSWLILLALLCPTIRFGDRAVDGVVKVLEMAATRLHLENVHYTLIGLSDALKLVAVALLMEFLVLFIMKEHTNTKADDKTLFITKRVSLCFVVFSFVELTKTLGCRLLSLRVNAESLFDLLKTTIKKEAILNKVMTRGRAATTRGSGTLTGGVTHGERIEAIAKLRDIPEWSVEQYLDSLYELALPVHDDAVAAFTDRITDLVAQFRNMREEQLDEHATCAAEFCWLTVAPAANICSERMYKEDLAVLLQNDEEAQFAFSLFDVDCDGFVSEPEVHSRMKSMYRERRNLARTLKDNDDVIQTLEMLIGFMMHTFAIILYLLIFGQEITHLLFSLSSVSVAGAFVFGNSLKTIYESVVFLFVVRPYQVGDAIIYKEALHQVKNFGLLSTQFLRFDGCKIWVPNEKLMQCDIINVTNSRNLIDRLTFEVDVTNMRPQLCDDLARRVAEMQDREEPRRLFSTNFPPSSYILGVSDPLKYSVGLTYKLAFNGEKFAKVVEARTLVNYVIGQWMIDHQLSHSTSVQPLYNFSPGSPVKSAGSSK